MKIKKSFVVGGKNLFIDESEDYELHDERLYCAIENNKVCLPGHAYLQKVSNVSILGNYCIVTFLDGTENVFESPYFLDRESIEKDGHFCDVWACQVFHKFNYEVNEGMLSVGCVLRGVRFVDGKKTFLDTYVSMRYAINMKTGRTYALSRREKCSLDRGFINTTNLHQFSYFTDVRYYSIPKLPDEMVVELVNVILDYKEKQLGYRPTVSANGFDSWLAFLASVNENPNYNQTLALLPAFVNRYYFNKYMKQGNPVKKLCELLAVPYCSSIRKLFMKEPVSLFIVASILETGRFSKLDNVIRLAEAMTDKGAVEANSIASCVMRSSNDYLWFYNMSDRRKTLKDDNMKVLSPFSRDIAIVKDGEMSEVNWINGGYHFSQGLERAFRRCNVWFIEELFKIYDGNETLVTKALCRSGFYVGDCIGTLYNIRVQIKKNRHLLRRIDSPFGKNLHEFDAWFRKMMISGFDKYHHDIISQAHRWYMQAAEGIRKIRYSENERLLEEEIEGFKFELPKTNRQLLEIGCAMNICVGSYANGAVAKRLDIVVVRDSDNYVVCMELSADAKQVYQVKLRSNKLTNRRSPVGAAVYKWMRRHRINCNTMDFNGPKFKQRENVLDLEEYIGYPEVI